VWRCSQRHRKAVDRDHEDAGLDALEPAIPHDAQHGQRALWAPATPALVQPARDVADAREVR
jgi:hypothetical protein